MDSEKMKKIAKDAEVIYEGACNPRGIARALVEACDFAADNGDGSDAKRKLYAPARLILRQLNYLMGLSIGDGGNVEEDIKLVAMMKNGVCE